MMSYILNILITILSSFFQNMAYTGTLVYIANHSIKRIFTRRFVLCFIIYTLAIYFLQITNEHFMLFSLFIEFFFLTVIAFFNSERNITQSLFLSIIDFVVISLIQTVFLVPFSLCFSVDTNDITSVPLCFVMILTFIAVILLFSFTPILKYIEKAMHFSYAAAIFFLLAVIIILLYILITKSEFDMLIPASTALAIGIFLLVFFLYQSMTGYKKKQELDDYTIYIPVLNRLIEDIQKKQDIYNDQLLSISQALEEKDDNTLKEALHEITEYNISQKISYQFLHLQNRLLAGLMYAKTTAAKEKKLRFDITISDYTCPCHCTDIELVDLVGILIDNAIDASHENDTIFITIDHMQDRFLFRIENPGPKADSAFLSKIFRPGYTTKEHSIGHGVGLSILRKTIQKYHGDVIVSNTAHHNINNKTYLCMEIHI